MFVAYRYTTFVYIFFILLEIVILAKTNQEIGPFTGKTDVVLHEKGGTLVLFGAMPLSIKISKSNTIGKRFEDFSSFARKSRLSEVIIL